MIVNLIRSLPYLSFRVWHEIRLRDTVRLLELLTADAGILDSKVGRLELDGGYSYGMVHRTCPSLNADKPWLGFKSISENFFGW